MKFEQYYVYIMASKRNGTLYIGSSNNLIRRAYEHRNGLVEGFTKRYKVNRLVYYEIADSLEAALNRERQLKKWKRKWKLDLIEKDNPDWEDLYDKLL